MGHSGWGRPIGGGTSLRRGVGQLPPPLMGVGETNQGQASWDEGLRDLVLFTVMLALPIISMSLNIFWIDRWIDG